MPPVCIFLEQLPYLSQSDAPIQRTSTTRSFRTSDTLSGASDIGQGSDSVLATIVCEELGTELDHVQVVSSDTDLTPVDLGVYSSRVTLMMGHAAQEACRTLRKYVQEEVAAFWNEDEDANNLQGPVHTKSPTCRRTRIYKHNTEVQLPLAKAFSWPKQFSWHAWCDGWLSHPNERWRL